MSDDQTRRNKRQGGPEKDRYLEAIREIPPMSNLANDRDGGRPYVPPPPFVSRIGGVTQGCGGILLSLLSLPMILSALWFGFYVWGPALFMGGGVLLVLATAGVWAGRWMPLTLSMFVILGLGFLTVMWESFIPAAAALSPIGQLGLFFAPATLIAGLALFLTFMVNALSVFYWKRLKQPTQRMLTVWAASVPIVVVLAVALHFTQQAQRENWFDDRVDAWEDQAVSDELTLGVNANVTLGYSFLTREEDDDTGYGTRVAELQAGLASGASLVRVSVSGDLFLEEITPRLFGDPEDEDDEYDPEEAAARIARQRELEADYMALVVASDTQLFLSDAQYSPYLLLQAADEDIEWEVFAEMHEDRIRRYAAEYQPDYFEIITEPGAYEDYSGLAGVDEDERLDNWEAHTRQLIAVLEEESPDTQVGVAIALQNDFDLDYYERALEIDGLDFVSFRLFQPAGFDRLEEVFEESGHPADAGKTAFISETWYGYCLAPQRSMALDSRWLELVTDFAAKESFSGVIASDYGCFIQAGGTLFQKMEDGNSRTEVWDTWLELAARWQAS